MELILNILFAILAFFLVRWIAGQISAPQPVAVMAAVIAAIIVFISDLAARVV